MVNDPLYAKALAWLLEYDAANPSIRYFALRDLMDYPADPAELQEARGAIMQSGAVPVILDAQHPDGYWRDEGAGYRKYQGTMWQIMLLGEFGAAGDDARVRRGVDYLLGHGIAANGGFAWNKKPLPSGVALCLNGNLLTALIQLGRLHDERVQGVLEWMAHAITGDPPIRYYAAATSGPDFACGINGHLPCGWGGVKALKGLGMIPAGERSEVVGRAIERGTDFLLRHDLARAAFPTDSVVSEQWFKLGFPLSYWSDILEVVAVLVAAGKGKAAGVQEAYTWVLSKRDENGRWKLENALNGRMWVNIERRNHPSKWITLRALRVMKGMAA